MLMNPVLSTSPDVTASTVTHDAARTAETCRTLLAEGADLLDAWRFGILQSMDYYTSYIRQGGVAVAHQIFDREPVTGEPAVDAAYAALAEHLATRDGWTPPPWAGNPAKVAPTPWFVSPLARKPGYFHDEALRVTPPEFRRHGVYIGLKDLDRA